MTQPVPEPRVVYNRGPSWLQNSRTWIASHQQSTTVQMPRQLPSFLGNRQTIVYSWAASMAIISWDEWHNNHILPRPARLWYATGFYLLLVLLGMVDAMVPIANALAIGYTIMLAWQYFNQSGQFGKGGES